MFDSTVLPSSMALTEIQVLSSATMSGFLSPSSTLFEWRWKADVTEDRFISPAHHRLNGSFTLLGNMEKRERIIIII